MTLSPRYILLIQNTISLSLNTFHVDLQDVYEEHKILSKIIVKESTIFNYTNYISILSTLSKISVYNYAIPAPDI